MIRSLCRWLAPPFCGLAAYIAGWLVYHPGWDEAEPLTDGSAASFQKTAERIDREQLLDSASPQERVRWLLEICKQPAGLARSHALYVVIQQMQPGDFFAAVADLPALGRELAAMEDFLRYNLIEASTERWLDVDRNAALRWLVVAREIVESNTLRLPEIGSADLSAAYRVLAKREPEWMREQIGKLGEKTHRQAAVTALMSAEAARNPKQAREWLETFRGSKNWNAILVAYASGLAAIDPRAAMEFALAKNGAVQPDGDSNLVPAVVLDIAAQSPSLAAEMLRRLEPKVGRELTWYLVHNVMEAGGDPFDWIADRAAADPELFDLGSEPNQKALMMTHPLVRADPLRALEFIATLPESQQPTFREAALANWSASDPAGLLDWLVAQPVTGLPAKLTNLENAARQEPARFGGWLRTLPAGELRDQSSLAFVSVLTVQGRAAEAIRYLPQNSASDAVVEAARKLAHGFGTSDPNAAGRWVQTLPAGSIQAEAARGLVGAWAAQKPHAAAAWVESLPPGGTRDAAAGGLAGALAAADPERAAVWLEQVGDPAARERAVTEVYRAWARVDAAQARAWLRDLPGVREVLKSGILRTR
jgi:hypothetical protein